MKSTRTILETFERHAELYVASLDAYSEEQFARKPDPASWSIGQMYGHLVVGTNAFHLQHIARCLEGKGSTGGSKKFPGRVIFLIGGFPPARIKVPPSERYTPKQPENIAQMRSGLLQVIGAMRDIEGKVAGSSPQFKSEHPALGFLSAREWYRLIEMHFRHHLRQKARLEGWLHTV